MRRAFGSLPIPAECGTAEGAEEERERGERTGMRPLFLRVPSRVFVAHSFGGAKPVISSSFLCALRLPLRPLRFISGFRLLVAPFRAALVFAVLFTSPLLAQKRPETKPRPKTPVYVPDLSQWRLELTPDLGGWMTEGRQELRIKLVDPKDPDPPKDEARWNGDEGDYYEGDGDYEEGPQKSADQLKRERLEREERARRNAWRQRRLLVWFNGEPSTLDAQVGHSAYFSAVSQNGENRLEILEPDSGRRLARSWWTFAARTRLRISRVRAAEDEWGGGNLEILEPSGDLASAGRRTASGGTMSWGEGYTHPTPPAGTFTVRWTGGYRGGKPFKVVVEAILDGGTDQERRWRFERLMLPGAGPATLGTVDVEN